MVNDTDVKYTIAKLKETSELSKVGDAVENKLVMPVKKSSSSPEGVETKKKPVYLKFLEDFMQLMNLSVNDVAEKMHMTRQAVYFWFIQDDAAVSKLQRTFDALGYDITFSYVPNTPVEDPGADVQMKLKLSEEPIYGPRIDFLSKAIKMYRIRKVDVQKKMKISPSTILYWQTKDDILISKAIEFAKAADLKLVIRVKPKNGTDDVFVYPDPNESINVPDYDSELLEDIRRNRQMIDYLFQGFIRDVAGMEEGNAHAGVRARRTSIQLAELLKEYKNYSLQLDK